MIDTRRLRFCKNCERLVQITDKGSCMNCAKYIDNSVRRYQEFPLQPIVGTLSSDDYIPPIGKIFKF